MNNIEEFESFMAVRFGDLIDRRRCLNGDDKDYMAWDMQVAKIVWMHALAQLEAAQKEIDALKVWKKIAAGRYEKLQELKSKFEKAETELSAANERLIVPVGYCIMPESLTAENGAKGALSGEFFTETDITCEECGGDCDEDDPCKHCNDLGVQTVRAAIGWSTIKDIYKMAVGATAIRQAGFTVEGE